MSYNLRGDQNSVSQFISSVGQRKSQFAITNFIPGGQLNCNQNQSTGRPFQQELQPHQQQQNMPPQQQVAKLPVKLPQQIKPPPYEQVTTDSVSLAVQSRQIVPSKQHLEPPQQQQQLQQLQIVPLPPSIGNDNIIDDGEHDATAKKTFWVKGTGRISKAEKMRKMNMRLRKLLQAKNAHVVLNEIFGSASYIISEEKCGFYHLFKATVLIDGVDHIGTGQSKVAAKTDTAEAAVKSIVLKKMSVTKRSNSLDNIQALKKKPAKKMPENALNMNPIELLNQMHPSAKYEEVSKVGNQPQFTVKCTVMDLCFTGTGPNKKAAKKQAAFAACSAVFGLQYSPEIINEIPKKSVPTEMDKLYHLFKATLVIDCVDHIETEKGKVAAKAATAKATVKPIVLKKMTIIKRSNSLNNIQAPKQKPAKKIPENALYMNPVDLLSQMHPSAKYEEISKLGNQPPFTIKCTVMDQCFTGTGPNKKTARKQAAYAACSTLLGLQYPPELLNEIPKKSEPTEMDKFYHFFKATLVIDCVHHIGTEKSKVAAKTATAEAAVKPIVLKKMSTIVRSQNISSVEEDEDEKMEEQESNAAEQVSWSHIADISSRANSLGQMIVDDPIKRCNSLNNVQAPKKKPAKKIPENAVYMNPVDLLCQMHLSANYEEVAKVGNQPYIQFTYKCIVMDQCFTGTGPNKKAARKQAAFAACSTLLGLQYPPELLNEIPKKSEPTEMDKFYHFFKATLVIDCVHHIGTEKSKVAAKTATAEAAVKPIVLKKMSTIGRSQNISSVEEDEDEKMEEQESNAAEQVSWSHIADISSRANSLGQMIVDDPIKRCNSLNNVQAPKKKPAKKIPENAVYMNPVDLLCQMHLSANYEEVAKVGNQPYIQFTYKCIVMDQCFTGTGPNKKAARKQAAFAACSTLLGLQYPPEILNEIPKKSTPIQMDKSYTTYVFNF